MEQPFQVIPMREKKAKRIVKTPAERQEEKSKRNNWTMLTKKFDNSNKTLLERYVDLEEKRNKEERWFDEKLDALRDEARKEIKLQTKYQPRSQIIGAKEWSMHTKAPDPSLVYSHFALKYGIPFSSGNHKKTMSEVVREINEYEIKNLHALTKRGELDPITNTIGLYIV